MWLYDHASVDRYDLSFANPIWWRPLRRPRTEASARREGRRKTRVDPDRPVTEGVESKKGAVTGGHAASSRFPSPLIEPDLQISPIRLSDQLHLKAHGLGRTA